MVSRSHRGSLSRVVVLERYRLDVVVVVVEVVVVFVLVFVFRFVFERVECEVVEGGRLSAVVGLRYIPSLEDEDEVFTEGSPSKLEFKVGPRRAVPGCRGCDFDCA